MLFQFIESKNSYAPLLTMSRYTGFYGVLVLAVLWSSQCVTASFSGRELLAGNHTSKKNFTGLDYVSVRFESSSPVDTIESAARENSDRGKFWKKPWKSRDAPEERVSGASKGGSVQGFDGNTQEVATPVVNPEDFQLLEMQKNLLLGLLEDTENELAKKT